MSTPVRPIMERILGRIEIDVVTECWLWQGAKSGGYGKVREAQGAGGSLKRVHRVVYEHLVGPIPEGLELDHVRQRGCVHRHCCNPEHLEPVTSHENSLRGESKNAQKTHCPAGHPYDATNTFVRNGGGRECRLCHRTSGLKHYRARGNANERKTHCPAGHPYDPANTRMDGGSRKCRACGRAGVNARNARERAKDNV